MKFGKEFRSQMVQEWQEAYMDYKHLKEILESISRIQEPPRRLKRLITRAFSGLEPQTPRIKEEEPTLSAPTPRGTHNHYQSLLMKLSEEGAEHELAFFEKLDLEFDKVRAFHEGKVLAVKGNARELTNQMDALIALRIKVHNPAAQRAPADDVIIVVSPPRASADGGNQGEGGVHMDVIQEVETRGEEVRPEKLKIRDSLRPAPLQVLDRLKINIEPDSPISTIKNVVMSSQSDPTFSKMELRKAEKKLRKAFVEFYQQLLLLKSYSFMNMLAFSKVMKKYDKITSRKASKTYLQMVDMSSLGSSDEVNKLIEKVEAVFIKHFASGDRTKGRKLLRPGEEKERHRITFTLGNL